MTHGGNALIDDKSVQLRGYSTKQGLLVDLVYTIVEHVATTFRPDLTAKK